MKIILIIESIVTEQRWCYLQDNNTIPEVEGKEIEEFSALLEVTKARFPEKSIRGSSWKIADSRLFLFQ